MTEALPDADLDRGELPRVALLQEPPHDVGLPRIRAQVDVQATKRRVDRSEPAGESELLGGRHAVAARQADQLRVAVLHVAARRALVEAVGLGRVELGGLAVAVHLG